jgi:hypothetical protein
VIVLGIAGTAVAFPFSGLRGIKIHMDRGGRLIDYALRVKEYAQSNRDVRFSGNCDSACTLYLSLPRSQTCISPGASFGFHLPYGSGPFENRVAASFMLRNYPGWVRNWINANGGLTNQMKIMDYRYASNFIEACSTSGTFAFG